MGKSQRKSDQDSTETITPLLAPLHAVQNLISAFDDQGVIIGGIAASLLGTPRFTADLDAVFLLSIQDIPRLIQAAVSKGIEPRIPEAGEFARKNRVLLLRHVQSGVEVDLSLGILPFEVEMVERSTVVQVGSIELRLPTPEDLIILKAVAHRQKDLMDIEAIAANHPGLEKERIQYWVEQFGEALDLPDLWKMIDALI